MKRRFMKKIILLLVIGLFLAGCDNDAETKNGAGAVKDVDDLEALHPQDFNDLAMMFEALTYEYDAVYSGDSVVISYTCGGQEEVNGNITSKLNFDLDGEDASVYVNSEGEEIKATIRGNTYTNDEDGFSFIVAEIKSKMPKILNLSSEHITKRDRERNTLVDTESVTIGSHTGTREIYYDTSENSITGEITHTIKHLGIFDEFIILLFEYIERDEHQSEFEITSFIVR